MTSCYLAYSYSTSLTKKEQTKIDEKIKKSREKFSKGFLKCTNFSLGVYAFYAFMTSTSTERPPNMLPTGINSIFYILSRLIVFDKN